MMPSFHKQISLLSIYPTKVAAKNIFV